MARPEHPAGGHKLQAHLADFATTSPFSHPPAVSSTGPLAASHSPSPAAGGRAQPPPPREKTAVGRSGVFDDAYGPAGDMYRRHSLDMGAAVQYSPPHARRPPPAAAPHPLSLNQAYADRGTKRSPGSIGHSDDDDVDLDDDDDEDDDDDDLSSDSDGSLSPHEGRVAGVATAEKPYACDQCELTFSRQHNLKSHALTHSSERPFSCDVCQTPFRRQHDLKRHMKLHTGEKPFKCRNCGRSFARLDALNRHMRAENFHACNQAAKKARTGDPKPLAHLEQRRASHNPQGSSPPWAHWTHRPSIAADEAMLRRMQERFGAPQPPQTPQPQHPHHHHHQHHPHHHHHPHRQPPPPPPQHHQPYYAPSRPAAAAPAGYGSAADPRAFALGHPTAPAQPHHPQHQQYQHQPPQPQYGSAPSSAVTTHLPSPLQPPPPSAPHRHTHAGGPALAAHTGGQPAAPPSPPLALAQQQHAPPEFTRYASTIRTSAADRSAWQPAPLASPPHPQQSQMPGVPGARSFNLPPAHHRPSQQQQQQQQPVRLPPMDLGPPRRHSLAVTSHLERYRAPDATPPPPPQQQQQPLPPLMPPQQQQQHQRLQQPQSTKPLASEPSQVALSPASAVPPATASPRLTLPAQTPSSQSQQPPKPQPPAQQPQPPPQQPQQQQQQPYLRPQPMAPLPEAPESAPPVINDRSRRGSNDSPAFAPDTRRSSIIALTNPQSEEEVRTENVQLKRRLDNMEIKYLAEIARLGTVVRELEIEKTLLKSMLLEKGASVPPSPTPHSAPDAYRAFSTSDNKPPARV